MNLQKLDHPQQPSPAAGIDAAQADVLAAVLSRVLHNEPNLTYMVTNTDARRAFARSLFASVIRAGRLYGEVLTTAAGDGAAVWIRPEHDMPFRGIIKAGFTPVPFGPAWEFTKRYLNLGAAVEEARQHLAPRPHWYLLVLGADASSPQKVLRDELIEPVLSLADSMGMSCYLETFSEHRLALYKDCGFQIAGAGRIAEGGPNFWAMARKPG